MNAPDIAINAERKAWATVQAQCALAGFKADLIDNDDGCLMLIVSRWALTRSFSLPADVESWLRRVGAPA
ncbi:MAG: hypothetical protein LCI02_09650 [Proteobacteria bacterium]|nr:hypothetical protein [Pseudomonadota bacterium]